MALTILVLFLSVCLTAIIVPFAKVISLRLGLISETVSKFKSQKNIPLLGGFPHLFALGVLTIVGIKLSPELVLSESGILLIILVGAFLIFVVGLLYDLKVLSPGLTFLGHLLVAVILVSSGVVFNRENQFLAYGLSLFYLVGATNAVKVQDDLDGLATGLAGIAAFFFGVIFYLQGNIFGLLLAGIVFGSTLAFLYYNFNPAQVQLGSNGNFLLGLMVGIMAVLVGGGELSKRTFIVTL
ncbi:MAG: MraY family glycosyltransferase, partial [Candidatus Zixiibacteriota bacterium]